MAKIIFDVDGVLADFVAAFTVLAGCQPPWTTRENQAAWSFKDKIAPAVIVDTWNKLRADPYWWEDLPPMVSMDVFWQIDELQERHEMLFVTARVSNHNVQRQTQNWLRDHGITNPSVVVSVKKGEIAAAFGADYHIDDKPENAACVHWLADKKPCKSFLLLHPHTKDSWVPAGVRRITSVSEYLAAIEEGK
jgi:5'(3')-deoxyribonucleotidase